MRHFQYHKYSIGMLQCITMGIIYLITASAVILFVNVMMRREALQDAEIQAKMLLSHNLAIHAYHSDQLKPHLFAHIGSDSFFDPVLMSSTYAVSQIDSVFRSITGEDYYYKECSINARNPNNEADAVEKAFLEALNTGGAITEYSGKRHLVDSDYYEYMRKGEVMESMCLSCHGDPVDAPAELLNLYGSDRSFRRPVGEVVSAVSIRIPISEAYHNANILSIILSIGFLVSLSRCLLSIRL